MHKLEISSEDLKKIKELITEFETYEDKEDEDGEAEPWDFDDVDNQREIGGEIIEIIKTIIKDK